MNFFPLCTAMVCPIMSGTIVERRDHVLITFFSLRVFSPSTLMRRWPSTNGPFFSERAIDSLFLHSPQAPPWCPPHLLEPSYRPGNAVRLRAERADKPRALRIRNPFHDDRPARLAQFIEHRLRRNYCYLDRRTYRLGVLRGYALGCALSRALHRPAYNFSQVLYLLPALDNVLVGALVVSRLLTQRREGPGRLRMIALDLSFAAPVRMIHGIHGHAANGGFFLVPPRAPGFSVGFVLMVEVADLAHRRHALHGKLAHFAGRQLHQCEITLFAQQLRRTARGTHHLPAAPRIQLEVVNHRAGRNVLELQRIARKNVRALAGGNRCAHFQSHGMEDVALLAIGVVQQRQIGAAVRVVFNGRHFRGHAELFAPEVHLAVGLLVAAAAVPDHNFALVVAPARTLLGLEQRLFRLLFGNVALVHDGDEPPRRRIWIKAFQSHRCLLPSLCYFSL